MTKFTSGPWIARRTDYGAVVQVGGERYRGADLADISSMPPVEEFMANAHLIAAAPDMYEALGVMTAYVRLRYGNLDPDVTEEMNKAYAARAKARGEDQ